MAWSCQATSYYLNQCWHRWHQILTPFGVTSRQWVKELVTELITSLQLFILLFQSTKLNMIVNIPCTLWIAASIVTIPHPITEYSSGLGLSESLPALSILSGDQSPTSLGPISLRFSRSRGMKEQRDSDQLTHWSCDKMAAILQTFSSQFQVHFFNENFWILNKISLKYVLL